MCLILFAECGEGDHLADDARCIAAVHDAVYYNWHFNSHAFGCSPYAQPIRSSQPERMENNWQVNFFAQSNERETSFIRLHQIFMAAAHIV